MARMALRVNGVEETRPALSELQQGLPPGTVEVTHAIRLETARAGVDPILLEGLADDDAIELELQDGLRIWTTVARFADDLVCRPDRSATQGAEPGVVDVPSALTLGPASRSTGGLAIRVLRVLGIRVDQEIAAFAAEHVEGRLQPGPGLYRCGEQGATSLQPVGTLEGKDPVLLFLHGTASSTSGSFGGLWATEGTPPITSLFRHYQGRVLAFQHRTLTESPVRNALALVERLATVVRPGAELHLVSHSRGGLIGELIARGMRDGASAFTPDELELFDDPRYASDRADLDQLAAVLQRADLRVTRFVRVACPARGTTLADRRLDRYFSVLVNLASLVPGLRANPVYEGLTALVTGVLKQRTEPEQLPGLEAMMPTSPLVRMLNNPEARSRADLHVLGGDFAGAGVLGRLKALATDFFFREDHDIVVNTPAMFGGTNRTTPIRYWIDTGGEVTHFGYFLRSDTSRRLVSALTVSSTQFHTLGSPPSAVTAKDFRKRATLSRPVVVVLPGIMGSELSVGNAPIWMRVGALSRGRLNALAMGSTGVEATGLLGSGYAAICDYLKQTHEVVPFPYDWRLPLEQSAQALREQIEGLLPLAEAAGQPIRLLAHSMGGLVVRTMLITDAGRAVWERMCRHADARFVMLGTPSRGSHAISAMLMGRDALVKKLALVDLRNSHAGILGTVAAFPGVLNLLPLGRDDEDEPEKWFDHAWWKELRALDAPEKRGLFDGSVETSKSAGFQWTLPDASALKTARDLARTLAMQSLDPARVVYVAGVAPETAVDVVKNPAAPSGRRVTVLASRRGDGRVLWDTGIPANVPTFFMGAVHGEMANDRRHFQAIADLLTTGRTARLALDPPVSRAAEERFELRDKMPTMMPDEAELVADALGGRRGRLEEGADTTRIRVRVRHDNLTNATSPVLVSHYEQDVIVAAEGYLDRQLGGRLSELLRLELYPGPVNTGVVVVNERETGEVGVHPGAIVAGLGMVGELTPGRLTSTLAHALTLYGSHCVGQERRRRQRQRVDDATLGSLSVAATAILVGSGEGGVSLADSVRALLRATLQANQRLRQASRRGSGDRPQSVVAQIDELDVIELYEDRAVEGLHALHQLLGTPEFSSFEAVEHLVTGDEGARRVRGPQPAGWWQRIRITEPDKVLTFEAVTQTARAPARMQRPQGALIDGFLDEAFGTTASDSKLGHTLLQMLVPHDFKAYAPDQQKLALLVDPQAAAYPWELLQDGFDRRAEPLSVAGGMVRQLLVQSGRHQVMRPTGNTALVVGNPIVTDRKFPPLKGARDEASAVASLLSNTGGYDVEILLDQAATPKTVFSALHDRPWRVLHLAAHGVFEHLVGEERVSGLVLNNGLFFRAEEADQLRYVPDLVFLNCCHLGQTRGDAREPVAFHRLAANLATQFIRMGAKAVIAAGWAVDDAAAKTFATSFYHRMLEGSLYGDAVLQARRDTFQRHGDTNSWGAYQCYGDPSFSLSVADSGWTPGRIVSERELCLWLDELPKQARTTSNASVLLRELETRLDEVPDAWQASAELNGLAGCALMALEQYERAISYFERLVTSERATATVRALEQFANCRVRYAGQLAREKAKVAEASRQLAQAEQMLDSLLAIGRTAERHALLGGVMKRRALIATRSATRRKYLRRMREAYLDAWRCSLASTPHGDPYPLANALAADVVLHWGTSATGSQRAAERQAVVEQIERLEDAARASAYTSTAAYNLIATAERQLLIALLDGALDAAEQSAIEAAFAAGLSRGSTPRERGSIRTQLTFFETMAATELSATARAPLVASLEALEKTVPE